MTTKKPEALVIGGSSGLGKELAKLLTNTHVVTVTGTTERSKRGDKPAVPRRCRYVRLDIGEDIEPAVPALRSLAERPWDVVVWAAGYEREDPVERHEVHDFTLMTNVSFIAPALLMKFVLGRHGALGQLVLVSGLTGPDIVALQPAMAGAWRAMMSLAESMWQDGRVGSVVHVCPDRMGDTWYYTGTERDTTGFARAAAVAERVHVFMRQRVRFRELRFKGETALLYRHDYSNPLGERFK